MTQKRWVLLEVEVDDSEIEAENVNNYVAQEITWLFESFVEVTILDIAEEYEE